MAEKRYFKENFLDEYAIKKEDIIIAVVDSGSNANRICDELNALNDEKENWKSIACDTSSFNTILLHELDVAKEQGYAVSDPFKKLMNE